MLTVYTYKHRLINVYHTANTHTHIDTLNTLRHAAKGHTHTNM